MVQLTIAVMATVAVTTTAQADSSAGTAGWLAWSSSPEGCGDASTFAARVQRALGRSPARAAADAHVYVTADVALQPAAAATGAARWVGEVHLRDDAGKDLGSRRLDRRDASCQTLLEAMAVVTALALADDGVRPRPLEAAADDGGLAGAAAFAASPASQPRSPEVAPQPMAAPPEAPAPTRPEPVSNSQRLQPAASLVRAPAPPLIPSSRRWRSGVEGGAKIGVGLLPGVAFGAEVSAYLSTAGGWRFFLAFGGWQRQTSLDALGRGASFQRVEATLGVCPLDVVRGRWEGAACLAGDVGRLGISRVGFPTPSTQDRLVLDAGLGAALNRRLVGPLAVGAHLGVTAPLLRDRISYGTTDGNIVSIFRESAVAVIGGLRLSAVF